MAKKKVRKTRRKKFEKPVDPMAGLLTKDIDPEPFVKGAKAMGEVMGKGARGLADTFFPSHDAQVRRERKKLRLLEQEIELRRLLIKKEKLLRELKEVGEP